MSSTQQLILLPLFIIRPVSSDQTDLASSGILTRCLKGTSFIHEAIVQKHVPVRCELQNTHKKYAQDIT